jgi:hypothetical protein
MSSTSVTQINVTNVNVFINQVNSAGQTTGMGPVATGTPIAKAAQQYSQSLQTTLSTKFNTVFGIPLPAQNVDNGYMGPIEADQPGVPPQCVIDQVTQDFSNWGLPTNTKTATVIAKTIAGELVYQGGVTNFTQGTLQVTSNESIVWMAGYGVFDIQQDQHGAVYCFGAALQF